MDEYITITLFDPSVVFLRQCDDRLNTLIGRIGDIRNCVIRDRFKFLVDTIISQMLSNKAAGTISSRLWTICEKDTQYLDQIATLSIDHIKSTGMSRYKAENIIGLARYLQDNPDFLKSLEPMSDQEVITQLIKIRGFGPWSAKMYLIFVLNRQDVLPFEDGAFIQAFSWLYSTKECKKEDIITRCEKWKPYSSIAARYLYFALDSGLTREILE